jgi:hypothetical protein
MSVGLFSMYLTSAVVVIGRDKELVLLILCKNCHFLFFIFIYSKASLRNIKHLSQLSTEFWFSSILVSALVMADSIIFLAENLVNVSIDMISEASDSQALVILL